MPITDGVLQYPFTKIAAIGNGDLQVALKSYERSQIGLFSNGVINKWAKYKAFQHAQVFTDRYEGPNAAQPTHAREVALRAANYGLTPPSYQQTIEATMGTEWGYNRPVAGQHPLQALDFEFYYADAVPPAKAPGDVTFYRALLSQYDFGAAMPTIVNPYNIVWADLPGMTQYYLCLYIKGTRGSTEYTWWKTADATIGDGGGSLVLTRAESDILYSMCADGPYEYYICGSKYKKETISTQEPSKQFIALPALNTAAMSGELSLSSQVLKNATVTHISGADLQTSTKPAQTFLVADDYTGIQEEGELKYFPLSGSAQNAVHFGIELSAMYAMGVTLQRSMFRIRLSTTLWGTVSTFTPERIVDQRNTEYSSIRLDAGDVATYYFILPHGAMNYDGATRRDIPVIGQYKSVNVSIIYNGYTVSTAEVRMHY